MFGLTTGLEQNVPFLLETYINAAFVVFLDANKTKSCVEILSISHGLT